MIAITYAEVARYTGGVLYDCEGTRPVAGVTIDSRAVGPGMLFVALPGRHTDGHRFLPEVFAQGGVALIRRGAAGTGPRIEVEDPLTAMGELVRRWIETHAIRVVGVTGSVGKTSLKELIAQALSARYVTGQTLSNYNTAIGLPLSFFAAPPAMTHFVAEMAMRARGEIRHLTEIAPPDVAVIGNIGPSHLETLGSMEAIQAAKGEILEGMREGGTAVLNYDDVRVRELGLRLKKGEVAWYGRSPEVQSRLLEAAVEGTGVRCRIAVEGQEVAFWLPWPGVHQALNAAGALLVAQRLGVEVVAAAERLSQIEPSRSRIQVREIGEVRVVEDVYNANPDSMAAALEYLASLPGRKVAVLGDMLELGAAEEESHRRVGEAAARHADLLVTVGERARAIAAQARALGISVVETGSVDEAALMLPQLLRPGDVVLFKASRGMALERLIARLEAAGGAS
ncbi:MAG: UDP-N-acetylmuramoyl-tripeptide--D-alanyl-D-alanine ligase [Firmicutes bacterium]|nr:UDP-N-acetylmuramoyl-tripeptide--D-alanyl-D-alanine ligase [Bacillota bacterium]